MRFMDLMQAEASQSKGCHSPGTDFLPVIFAERSERGVLIGFSSQICTAAPWPHAFEKDKDVWWEATATVSSYGSKGVWIRDPGVVFYLGRLESTRSGEL
jgi:hypothetical protein